ncbi:MAG: PAC2 family protein [Actinomycetales bacterium]|nr:PAC2 family protein [Actinomycetales bacterium]
MSQLQTGRVLIVAFEGWNDAGEAASGAARVIARELNSDVVAAVDPEDYYDFQFSRPMVSFDEEGNRQLAWPTTEMYAPGIDIVQGQPEKARVHVLLGVEPSRRWKAFAAEVLEMVEDREIDAVVFLGALLADVPHTRPIATTITSQNQALRSQFGYEKSDYEGPVGILSVLGMALEKAGIPTVSIWGSVPHYAHTPPVSKASLSLLLEVERVLGISFGHESLAEEAFAWERAVDELCENDEELAGYVKQLELARDEYEAEVADGDVLAAEVERFLRDNQPPKKD